jgi:hypothetical protein
VGWGTSLPDSLFAVCSPGTGRLRGGNEFATSVTCWVYPRLDRIVGIRKCLFGLGSQGRSACDRILAMVGWVRTSAKGFPVPRRQLTVTGMNRWWMPSLATLAKTVSLVNPRSWWSDERRGNPLDLLSAGTNEELTDELDRTSV